MGRDIGRPYLTLTPRDGGLGGGESIIITWWIKARELSETAASRLWEPTPISRAVAHAFSMIPSALVAHQLAIIANYHLTRENATFRFVILHGHLWGGIFQMAVIGGRQGTGGNGRWPSG